MMRSWTPLLGAMICGAAIAAPKIETVVAKPNPAQFAGAKAPEVEVAVTVSRSRFDKGSCDARLDFGDGEGRNVEFGVATTRTLRHVYKKDGSYTIAVRGAGAAPCDGSQQTSLKVAGEPKKPAPKKGEPEKKKAEPKKATKKDAKKKDESK